METLDVHATPFIPGWRSLIARVCADDPHLQMLDLCGQGVDDALACDLSAALLMSRQLQHLDLTFNAVTAAGAHRLAHALSARASGLLSLNLNMNPIGAEGAESLARALANNSTLTHLCLDDARVGDSGAVHLARCLEVNSTLAALRLECNEVGDGGASALALALETSNHTLRSLRLGDNKIIGGGAAALVNALHMNTALRFLSLDGNSLAHETTLAMGHSLRSCPPPRDFELRGVDLERHKAQLGLPFCFSTGKNKEILSRLFPGASKSAWTNDKIFEFWRLEQQERKAKLVAFCMGLHWRLGAGARGVRMLQRIADFDGQLPLVRAIAGCLQ